MSRKFSDPNGGHARIYHKIALSPAWRVLSWRARSLYTDLRVKLTATNNGNINAALSELKHIGWTSPSTLANALFELRALGLIVQTRGGGVEYGSKVCALYAFTDQDVFEQRKQGIPASKATHAYARFTSVAEAVKAKRDGVAALHAAAVERRLKAQQRKKSTLQEIAGIATGAVAIC